MWPLSRVTRKHSGRMKVSRHGVARPLGAATTERLVSRPAYRNRIDGPQGLGLSGVMSPYQEDREKLATTRSMRQLSTRLDRHVRPVTPEAGAGS
jgi:hypothetical protein